MKRKELMRLFSITLATMICIVCTACGRTDSSATEMTSENSNVIETVTDEGDDMIPEMPEGEAPDGNPGERPDGEMPGNPPGGGFGGGFGF